MNEHPSAPAPDDDDLSPAAVKKALARVESEQTAFAVHQARAHASVLLASMPEWWKEKLRVVARTHFSCRKGRRATAKVIRDYQTWTRKNARTHELQAADKDRRHARLARRLMSNANPAGVSWETIAMIVDECGRTLGADVHP